MFPVHATRVLRQSSCHEVLLTSLLRQWRCYYILMKTTHEDPTTSSLCRFWTCSLFLHVLCVHGDHITSLSVSTAFPRRCASPYCILSLFCVRGGNVVWTCPGMTGASWISVSIQVPHNITFGRPNPAIKRKCRPLSASLPALRQLLVLHTLNNIRWNNVVFLFTVYNIKYS